MSDISFSSDIEFSFVNCMGDDKSIVQAMLVSTSVDPMLKAETSSAEQIRGRLRFLLKNRHGSPFEHTAMTFFMRAPIFVYREFHRHRIGFSYNEESGRYTKLEPLFYIPGPDRDLVQEGKPGAYEFVAGSDQQGIDVATALEFTSRAAYLQYEDLLEKGIAREVARMVLPLNIYSRQFVTCNVRSLMNFLSLRTHDKDSFFPSYPQREIEMAAEKMEYFFSNTFPITHSLFRELGSVAP